MRKTLYAALYVSVAFVASTAQASTITASFNGPVNWTSVTRTILDGPTYGLSGGPAQVFATLLSYTGPEGTFYTYCIEPQQGAGTGTFTIDPDLLLVPGNIHPTTTLTAAKVSQIHLLFGQAPDPFDPGLSAATQAAFQIALWEIVRETSATLDISSGNVIFSGSSDPLALTLAQSFLDNVSNGVGVPYGGLWGLYNADVQDMITHNPEPATWVMISMACLAAALAPKRS